MGSVARTLVCFVMVAGFATVAAAPSAAATLELRYTPFAPDGVLREGLRATPAFGGACTTGSFVVAGPGVFRCFVASAVYDPCYLDAAAGTPDRAVVACVQTPWSQNVLRLRVRGPLDGRYGAQATDPPWALRLASGRRCVFVTGAAPVVAGRRMNYDCGRRYLFGTPDRRRPTWRIRQALTPGGVGTRAVAIATAWR
jgi:hypothetical protein